MKNPAQAPKNAAKNPGEAPRLALGRRSFLQTFAAAGLLPLIGISSAAADDKTISAMPRENDWPPDTDPNYWSWIRSQFSIPREEAYFNTGTIGACPRQVLDAVVASMRDMEKTIAHYDYRPEHTEYIAGYRPQEALRKKAGILLNADGKDIALTQNATMGINFIANGLDLKPGDEVLVTDQEHPGAISPWELRAKRQGIIARKVAIQMPTTDPGIIVKSFSDAIGPRTKVIAVPHITSRNGIVMPVRELCELGHSRGQFVMIDGAQALGQLRVDVKAIGCDAYAASPHKWLLAPPGNGLLYVKPERQAEISPTLASVNWNDYTPADGVLRLMQFGTANAALLAGLDAAMDFYLHIGPEKIERRITGLADRLRTGLKAIKGVSINSPLHPAMTGAMVTYGITGLNGQELMDELWKRKQFRVRAQGDILVRQSVHYYNSAEEIDATLEVVKSMVKS